jgi:hypothetical protein
VVQRPLAASYILMNIVIGIIGGCLLTFFLDTRQAAGGSPCSRQSSAR